MPSISQVVVVAAVAVVSAASVSRPASAKEKAPSKDEAAVLAVIDGQIAARWANDFDKWATYWVHAPYVRRIGSSPSTGAVAIEGWDAVAADAKAKMASGQQLPPITRDNYNVRVYKDAAFVTFDQRADASGKKVLSRETRVLEKHAGKWKLIYIGSVMGPDPAATAQAPAPATPTPAAATATK